jgi:hypothetical protein
MAIRLLLRQDPAVPGGGHALLYLQGAAKAPADARLVIRRLAPEAWLGPAGWQPTRAEIAAEGPERGEGSLFLKLGPAVVDRIQPWTKVEVTLPSLGESQLLVWPALEQSPGGGAHGGLVVGGRRPSPQREPRIVPAPEPPPLPEPEPPPLPAPAPAPFLAADPPRHPPRKPRKPRAWPWVLLALLPVAGGLAVWQWQTGEPERILCELGVPEMGILTCAPPVVDSCPATLPLDQRSDCYLKALDADALFALAEQLGMSGLPGERDLAWTLFAALGERGYAVATFELGLCYDPLLPQGCSLQPRLTANARQALEHYSRADAAGAAEARTRIGALCGWLVGQTDIAAQAAKQEFCK